MRRVRTRVGIASVLVALIACGGRYGADDETPPDPSAAEAGASSTDASSEVDAGADAADAADADSGLIGPGEVSAACLRLATGIARTPNDTHVVSIYEGTTVDNTATATVKVIGTDAVLVLTSYDPLTWKVMLDAGASVKQVFLEADSAGLAATNVTGLPSSVPITKRSSAAYARGYTRDANSGGGSYVDQIAALRIEIGGLETTYQGTYTGSAFTVGGPAPDPSIEYYDTRVACSSACARTGTITQWANGGSGVTVSGLTATINAAFPFFGTEIRTANGARCGKHYFELETDVALSVDLSAVSDNASLSSDPNALTVPASTRVGAAVDYELGTIVYTTRTGTATPSTHAPVLFGAWYRDTLGPAVAVTATGVVTLVTRPPFALPVPAGYAADY